MAAQPTKMMAVLRDLAEDGGASLSGLVSAHGAYTYVCIKSLELKGLVEVNPRTDCYEITAKGREYLEARA